MAATPALATLTAEPDWNLVLAPLFTPRDLETPQIQCQLVFSLLTFLTLSIRDFLFFLFESPIPMVKQRVGIFMGNHPTMGFAPGRLFRAWHDRFPKSIPQLHSTIIKPCMEEIALQESDKVINDARLKVQLKSCTLDYIRTVLNPGILPGIYLEDTPYTWDYLSVFTTSPNEYLPNALKLVSLSGLTPSKRSGAGVLCFLGVAGTRCRVPLGTTGRVRRTSRRDTVVILRYMPITRARFGLAYGLVLEHAIMFQKFDVSSEDTY
ncbi:hypothetical protein B0H10DRAFT_1951485 [Mycena sp. CBHHK59/15]|nr:hypothetical protein B0H10DRAFT_1951485 [Mycena sp. CBHHK59/15]